MRGSGASRSAGWGSRCPCSSRPRGSGRRRTRRRRTGPSRASRPARRRARCRRGRHPAETATSAPASARPARPRRTPAAPRTSDAQSAAPSARAPSRRACPSSRSTAGKPTPAATAATTIQGRRHAAPSAATRANDERRDDDEAVERGDVRRVERGLNCRRVAQAVPGVSQGVVRPRLERHGEGRRADGKRRDRPPAPVAEERGDEREPARRGEGARRGGRLQERPGVHDDPHGRRCRKHGSEGEPVSQRPSLEDRRAPPGATCRAGARRAPPRPRLGEAASAKRLRGRAPGVRRSVDGDEGARPADGSPCDERVRHDLRPAGHDDELRHAADHALRGDQLAERRPATPARRRPARRARAPSPARCRGRAGAPARAPRRPAALASSAGHGRERARLRHGRRRRGSSLREARPLPRHRRRGLRRCSRAARPRAPAPSTRRAWPTSASARPGGARPRRTRARRGARGRLCAERAPGGRRRPTCPSR